MRTPMSARNVVVSNDNEDAATDSESGNEATIPEETRESRQWSSGQWKGPSCLLDVGQCGHNHHQRSNSPFPGGHQQSVSWKDSGNHPGRLRRVHNCILPHVWWSLPSLLDTGRPPRSVSFSLNHSLGWTFCLWYPWSAILDAVLS